MENGTLCDTVISITKYHEFHYVGVLDMYNFESVIAKSPNEAESIGRRVSQGAIGRMHL